MPRDPDSKAQALVHAGALNRLGTIRNSAIPRRRRLRFFVEWWSSL